MKLRTRITVLSVVVLVGLSFASASAGAEAVDGARMGQAGSAIPAAAPALEVRAGTIVGGVTARCSPIATAARTAAGASSASGGFSPRLTA